ncbi:plasmid stability protein StbB [Janibacter sp. HTCC2649]|uniref:type II toxin-antitoxin system VapC family toxin n=1 Tax=Janibacter sp. HTCC2649 TaxID=313589 RepID=UPI000066ED2D|nr:type II toxin-antitoxin system VapC family toxin [Janibacter sp. HTCC2649]EAP99315.1 plasmid stability protein StbB [Janibacter sp. HTCC2649]
MIVLDTNVVSETMRADPDGRVAEWMDTVPWRQTHITVITVGELLQGAFQLPDGRRRDALEAEIDAALMTFDGRVLDVDARTAPYFATIRASRRRAGRPIGISDAWIAAVCRRHDVPLLTRNVTDFEGTGIAVINPWEPA